MGSPTTVKNISAPQQIPLCLLQSDPLLHAQPQATAALLSVTIDWISCEGFHIKGAMQNHYCTILYPHQQ